MSNEDDSEATIEAQNVIQARGEQVEKAMRDAGQADSTPIQEDYFAFDAIEQVFLPDGVSYVDIKILNEGARRKYMNSVNREVKLQKATGDAVMKLASGDERKAILESSIVNWNLSRGGQPLAFSDNNLKQFLDKASPKVIDLIEKKVREINPWLTGDVTVEEIDKQIAELESLREQRLAEDEGKAI